MRPSWPDGLARLDAALGERLEDLQMAHHRRRLRHLGWEHALDARGALWADGPPQPRSGNSVEVLIDGASVLPRIAADMRSARSHIHLAGWHVTPEFALTHESPPARLRELLAEKSREAQVRVLLWAGAPLPLFQPSREVVRSVRAELVQGNAIRCELDARERPLHCHHEKLVIVDDRVAYVGGIDLTSLGGDRSDTNEHPPRPGLGWHDVAVRIEGRAVADVAAHFRLRWQEVAGEALPELTPPEGAGEVGEAGDVELQVVRTVPEHIYGGLPKGDFRILEAYVRAFRAAQRLIYIENQFLWSPELVKILEEKLKNPPSPDFRIVMLLPARPARGGDDTRGQLGVLLEADRGQGRVAAYCLYARGQRDPLPVYVHAKVAIVDDAWLTVGSANLNEHSLFNDSEVNLVSCDPELARRTRERLWREHLDLTTEAAAGDPTDLVDSVWQPMGREQLSLLQAHRPLNHKVVRLPAVSRRSRRLLGPLQSFLVDG